MLRQRTKADETISFGRFQSVLNDTKNCRENFSLWQIFQFLVIFDKDTQIEYLTGFYKMLAYYEFS